MIEKNFMAFLIGVFTWPFMEYVLHRYLGHVAKFNSEFKKQHGRHHIETHYFAPNYLKVVAAVPVSVFLVVSLRLVTGAWITGASFTLGFLVMYAVYEWVHWSFHFHAPRTRWGMILRKHHFAHHFHNAQMNHGVTMIFWDRVFRTHAPVDVVRVPRQFALPWLSEEHSSDFEIR